MVRSVAVMMVLACLGGCRGGGPGAGASFDSDVGFLAAHTEAIVLGEGGGARVLVAPAFQGRVMTSTTGGADGLSHGWMNRAHIASGELVPHINVFGGEDRFWLGPEGGQFAIYFAPGDPFDLEHWQTPPLIDAVPYEVVSRDETEVVFRHEGRVTNWSGTTFEVRIDRTVRLLTPDEVATGFALDRAPDVPLVGYESVNTITNIGAAPWTAETGLLSIWILGMFRPTDSTTVVVPVVPGAVARLGPVVNDAYFGEVPPDRLVVDEGVVFFRGDGKLRSKIGVGPARARPALGSYDPRRGLLTLVQYTRPSTATAYVNSMWEQQERPYGGDVVNSYNDGPPAPGVPPLGPFYELETSSPAASLLPGESLTHVHRTVHLQGDEGRLAPIAERVLGVELRRVARVFGAPGS